MTESPNREDAPMKPREEVRVLDLCGPVHDIDDIKAWDHLRARGMLLDLVHPKLGPIPGNGAAGFPLKLSATPGSFDQPAPLVGAHNEEIFCGLLGISKGEVARLQTEGIV